jgi:hypothetical protein
MEVAPRLHLFTPTAVIIVVTGHWNAAFAAADVGGPMFLLPLLICLSVAPASAAEQRIGALVELDVSTGTRTHIDRLGLHPGATWMLLGQHQGLVLEARYDAFAGSDVVEDFPGLGLGWTMVWGQGALRPYHQLGVVAEFTGVMPEALTPVLPLVTAQGGLDWRHQHIWLRGGVEGFWTLTPALGVGPHLSAGVTF